VDRGAPWYTTFFDEEYFTIYERRVSPEYTQREVDGVVSLLGLQPGARVLDLCCGHGRHSIELARRGHDVTGQDLSEVFLRRAERDSAEAGVGVSWVRSDMREIPFDAEFDVVVNLFSAFGYLESEAEDQRVLGQVRKALRPDGRFLIDMNNRDTLARRFRPADVDRRPDGTLIIEERQLDVATGRIRMLYTTVRPDGGRSERSAYMRLYGVTELSRMLRAEGLDVVACYGGLDGSALTLDSSRLVIVARRPE
jgi:SAM-dependent methyltransferase